MSWATLIYGFATEWALFGAIPGTFITLYNTILSLCGNRQSYPHRKKTSKPQKQFFDYMKVFLYVLSALSIVIYSFFKVTGIKPIEVPAIVGTSCQEAMEQLESVELRGKMFYDESTEDGNNYVVKEQKPAGGEITFTKTSVKLFLVPAASPPEESDDMNGSIEDIPRIRASIGINVDPEFSDASISPRYAVSGDTVELHIKTLNYGFDLNLIDRNGNEVPHEREDAGIVTFVMPDCDVTVYLIKAEANPDPLIPPEPVVPESLCSYGLKCPTRSFIDLDPDAWYHSAVDFVVANDLLSGYSDTFSPTGTVTRAEVATILCKMTGWPDSITFNESLTDVTDDAWYAPAVSWAVNNGIMTPYDDGTFRPNDFVTTEGFITMLWRYDGSPASDLSDFYNPSGSVSDYAKEAITWAESNDVFSFIRSTSDPQDYIPRIEIAVILKNYISGN